MLLLIGLSLFSLFLLPSLVAYTFNAMGDPTESPIGSAVAVLVIVSLLAGGWRWVRGDRR